jgi:hypothetical protein
MWINAQCTIQSTDSKMYTYCIISWTVIFIGEKILRVAWISWGPTRTVKGHIVQGHGHGGYPWSCPLRSEGSQGDQAGEAGPFDRRPRVSKLAQGTIRLESTQIRRFKCDQGIRLISVSRGQTQGLHSLKLKARGNTRLKSTQVRWLSW